MLRVYRAAMLAATAGHLIRLGRLDDARQFRREARDEILQEAAQIKSPETRQAFTAHWASRLQVILPDEPLEAFPRAAKPENRPFAVATWVLGMIAWPFGLAACFTAIVHPLEDWLFLGFALGGCICFVLALLTALASTVRGEKQTRMVLKGLALASLGAGICAALFPRAIERAYHDPPHRRAYDPPAE